MGEQQAHSPPGTSTWSLCHRPNLNSSTPTASKSPGRQQAVGWATAMWWRVVTALGLCKVSSGDFTAGDTG